MSRKKKVEKIQRHFPEPGKETFHQQNPPPGKLAACGKVVAPDDVFDSLRVNRDEVDCPDCLSRPDPTIVIR